MIYRITPVPKPRQTQRDKWAKRPAVLKYRAFADECRLLRVMLPKQGATVTFVMPMPKSWSQRKRAEMDGKAHKQKPDLDNLLKALADAVYPDDSEIWDYSGLRKIWGTEGAIEITCGNVRKL